MTKQSLKEDLFKRTISNGTGKPHTHGNRGGGHMLVLIPTYDKTELDSNVKAEICDLFINQMVKVVLQNMEETEHMEHTKEVENTER